MMMNNDNNYIVIIIHSSFKTNIIIELYLYLSEVDTLSRILAFDKSSE